MNGLNLNLPLTFALASMIFLNYSTTCAEEAVLRPDPKKSGSANFQPASKTPEHDELLQIAAYVEKHPDDSDAHYVLAAAYEKLGMNGLYAEELETAWRLNPKALLFLVSALKAYSLIEELDKFNKLVEEAYSSYHDSAQKLSALGLLFQANRQDKLAMRFFSRALELKPKDLNLRAEYCNSLLAQKRYRELLTACKPLFSTSTTSAQGTLLKGLALYGLNESNRAIPLLKHSYEHNLDNPVVAEAYFRSLMSAGKYQDALLPAMVALAFQAPYGQHLNDLKRNLIPVFAKSSPIAIQAGIYQIRSRIPPGRILAGYYFSLADILDKVGKIHLAVDCYTEGLQQDNTFAKAYMRLAHDQEILGEPSESVMSLYEAATLRSQNDEQIKASFERMKARLPAVDKDIASKLKHLVNQIKYKS